MLNFYHRIGYHKSFCSQCSEPEILVTHLSRLCEEAERARMKQQTNKITFALHSWNKTLAPMFLKPPKPRFYREAMSSNCQLN